MLHLCVLCCLGLTNKPQQTTHDVDEFDMLAQSRNNGNGASTSTAAVDVNAISSLSALPALAGVASASNTPKKESVS